MNKEGILSHIIQEALDLLGVRKTRTTVLHSLSDGMVEDYKNKL